MSGLDLLAASIGLAASALAAALLLPLWRRAPVPAYRLAVCVLAAALALPLLQWGARALGVPVPHPVGNLARAWAAASPSPTAMPAQEAQPLSLEPTVDLAATVAPPELETASELEAHLPWRGMLMALWVAGAATALSGTIRRLLATRALLARARPVTDEARLSVWSAVRADSRVGARTRLCESDELCAPACAGLLRPVVVLPADDALAQRPELFACVLTHELVHLERRDPWVMLGEEFLRAAFWFHPAAWWLVARLGALRELSCDCLVVRRTGKRKRYASALIEYATWMQRPAARATWAAVVPWSESRGHLTRRIEMLLQPEPKTQSSRVVTPAAVGVLMTFLWSGQLALATSSCAGTRENHEHEHVHASEAHEPVAAHEAHTLAPIEVHVDTQAATPVERHVIVVREDDGESQVLQGAEAKAWIEEHRLKHKSGKGRSQQALVDEIRGAWRTAEGGEREVIVVGPDGKQLGLVHSSRSERFPGQPAQGEAAARRYRLHTHQGDVELRGDWIELEDGGVWVGSTGEGGATATIEPKRGRYYFHSGKAAPVERRHPVGDDVLLRRTNPTEHAGEPDLDQLRRELEETRAALEEQRQALEELRRQIEKQRSKQREKTDTVGAR